MPDTSKRSPSPRPYRDKSYSDRRYDGEKMRERDNGWAGRRERDGSGEGASRKRARDSSRSRERRDDSKYERSRRDKDRNDSRDERRPIHSGYSSSYNDRRDKKRDYERSRSRSPRRKRQRSLSSQDDRGSDYRRRRYENSEDKHRGSREERDDRALVRREADTTVKARSRSGSADSEQRKIEERKKANFGNSGLLAAATNTVQRADGSATVLKYNEPPEARKPTEGWRLYEFKENDENTTRVLEIHRQSVYLFGRDAAVSDIALDHPSCSKQHAALQYRYVVEKNEFGEKKGVIKPFIIDLESTNGTHVNSEAIPPARFYELKINDVIKFGLSTKEFVLLNESAAE